MTATDFVPPEFLRLATPGSATDRLAHMFDVDPATAVNWRWHMGRQLRTAKDFPAIMQPDARDAAAMAELAQSFEAGVTPYYFSLQNHAKPESCPIRLQGLPQREELEDPVGRRDPLDEEPHSPVPEVVQVYPDRVAFCVAQLCPVYCRYCFRKRRDEQEGLHYNRRIVARGIDYIRRTPAIRDVLITGGDPFIASDQAIVDLVAKLHAIPHVEMIRFGTRTPVTLPYRVTRQLAAQLAQFHPIYVNTHFNCVEEVTPEAVQAVANLVDHGIPVANQSVLLRGVNDSTEKLIELSRALLKARVRPYYIFHPHLVAGTQHLRVPVDQGMAIVGGMRGQITGLGIPSYIVDTPAGKIPLLPDQVLQRDGADLLLEDRRGEVWREQHAFF